jgi:hypothetical protein
MIYKTFAQIRSKVQLETDTEAEEFVQPQEFIDYVNDGIDEVESEIHKLGLEDEYFLTRAYIPLVQGQEEYDLPGDIYSNKIKKVLYRDGASNSIYTIKRLRGPDRFEEREYTNQYNTITEAYKYMLVNTSAAVMPKMLLVPPSRETSTTNVLIWYTRNANRWDADDTQFCDLPEIAMQYLYAYVAWRIWAKDGTGKQDDAKAKKDEMKNLMVETLTNMIPDEDSEMYKDLSAYRELA